MTAVKRSNALRARHWVLALLGAMAIALGWAAPASAVEPVVMRSCEPIDLDARFLAVLSEADAPVDVRSAADRAFSAATGHRMNFGLRRTPVWLRFSIAGGACLEPLTLDLGNPYANGVRVYRRGSAGAGTWGLVWDADASVRNGQGARVRRAALTIEPRGHTDYLVAIDGPAAVVVAPTIASGGDHAASRLAGRVLVGGILVGGIVALAIYCVCLGVMLRFRGLLTFSVSALALALFYASSTGALDEILLYLSADVAGARDASLQVNGFAVLTAALFHWVFVRRLLGQSSPDQPGLPEMRVLAGWGALFMLIPFLSGRTAAMFCMGVAALAIPFVVREVVRAMRAGHPLARVTLISFGVLAGAAAAYIAGYVGLLPLRLWVLDALALGVWAEAIALSVAIGVHVKDLRGRQEQLVARTEELSLLSQLDPLTGLGNRRAYDTVVASEIAQCQRSASDAVVLVVDIDHFKQVNDTWGHGFGDSVIRMLGATIANSVRAADRAFRYGGEEFVLLLPEIGVDSGRAVAERIMREFTNCSPTAPDGSRPFFSVSIGLARLRRDDTPESLFARADAAMYRAKQAGRCRVECEDAPGATSADPHPASPGDQHPVDQHPVSSADPRLPATADAVAASQVEHARDGAVRLAA